MFCEDIIRLIVSHIAPKQRSKLHVGVLASGNGSNLQALIDFSKKQGSYFTITSAISNTPGSFALERSAHAGISHYLVDHRGLSKPAFETRLIECLVQNEAELVVLAGFMRVLSTRFLTQFNNRVINLHPSLLPKHPGLNAIEKALQAHDKETGCTVHLVDQGLDTGPIIGQLSCPLDGQDNLESATRKIRKLEHRLLPDVVNQIAKMVITRDCA
jgi:formyltetrahydrofolate-dependent phosphoribosylglycinamide formyltransferase